MDQGLNKKPNGWALLPFLIFIVIYLGAGLILQRQGVEINAPHIAQSNFLRRNLSKPLS